MDAPSSPAEHAAPETASAPHAPITDPAKAPLSAYQGIGSDLVTRNHLAEFGWTDEEVAAFLEGIRAALRGKPYPLDAEAEELYFAMGKRVTEEQAKKVQEDFAQPARLEKYLQEMSQKFKLQQSDSGLCYSIVSGTGGVRPRPQDTVVVSFDVAAFDAKTRLPQLAAKHLRVRVADLLPGLAEGVQMLAPGAKGMFLVPPALSFGSGAWPRGVPPGTPIFFRVELEQVIPAEAAGPNSR